MIKYGINSKRISQVEYDFVIRSICEFVMCYYLPFDISYRGVKLEVQSVVYNIVVACVKVCAQIRMKVFDMSM